MTAEQIFWGVRKLFEYLGSKRSLVVFFDDIQWADRGSSRGRCLPLSQGCIGEIDLAGCCTNILRRQHDGTEFVHPTPNHSGDEVPHVLVRLWSEERDRAARLAKMAIDAGLAEKQVRLAERQGQIIAQIFTTVLDDDSLGLSREQRDAGRSLAARHLRALEP